MSRSYGRVLAGAFLLMALLIVGWGALLWAQLDAGEREALAQIFARRGGYPFVLAALLLLGLHGLLRRYFGAYARAARRLAEETRMIRTVNPAHRVGAEGPGEIALLGEQINALAEQHQQLHEEIETRVATAQAELGEERNRLAALISELAEGVLVCDAAGRILLYNQRARQILERSPPDAASDGAPTAHLGLGRSLYGFVDRAPIAHALETVQHRQQDGASAPHVRFVTHSRGGQLLRVAIAPVREGGASGFVLTLEDVTRQVESERRSEVLLDSFGEAARTSLAAITAAVDALEMEPEVETARRGGHQRLIRDEAVALSEHLAETTAAHAENLRAEWLLEEMLASDLLAALARSVERQLGIRPRVRHAEEGIWLQVDSYTLVLAVTHLVSRLHEAGLAEEAILDLERAGRSARLDLVWTGRGVDADMLQRWRSEPLAAAGRGRSLTSNEVIQRHRGVIWSQFDPTTDQGYLRLFLPIVPPALPMQGPIVASSRPEFYDFDLFARPDPSPELDDRALASLAYTVFDTETTGLDPAGGDEIIALAAVRIVNGRLLRNEVFDQRVKPRVAVSSAALAVHGISDQMLEGEPRIEEVLPRFQRFAEETVLVGHNAAFDLRFLQLEEARSGVRFTQPVLDTLLLSAVAQPEQHDYALEALAARLGVPVIGRHTSVGDAVLTARLFLRLLPLLSAAGITTLGQARAAAQQTMLARIRY